LGLCLWCVGIVGLSYRRFSFSNFRFLLRVAGLPVDVLVSHVLKPLFARGDIDPLPFSVDDLRLVLLGIDLELEVVDWRAFGGLREDLHRPTGREHAVHPRGADADPLLASALSQTVEFAPVEKLTEDQGDLLFDDSRPVVLDRDAKTPGLRLVDPHPNLGQNARLLASIERVVDGFFDGRQQGFARVVETEQVAVLGKKLADRHVALLGGHRLGGGPA